MIFDDFKEKLIEKREGNGPLEILWTITESPVVNVVPKWWISPTKCMALAKYVIEY